MLMYLCNIHLHVQSLLLQLKY